MADLSITVQLGDTLTVYTSAGQAPDPTGDPSAGADPNASAAPADAGTPTPADVPAAPPAEAAPPTDPSALGVVQPPDVLSVGGQPSA